MKLTVLGSGSAEPHPERSSSAYWLETSGGTVLLDCGPSSIIRMAQEKCDWANIDAIWISHFHLDHCGGLAPFLASIKHAGDTRQRSKPLRIFGSAGLRDLLRSFNDANNYRLFEQRFPVEVVEINELESFAIVEGAEAVAFSTHHTPESHAMHIRDGDSTLLYTSDTGFSEELGGFARGVGLFLIECSFVRDKPVERHLELAEAMYLIRKARPERTILTHLYPEWDGVDLEVEVARFDLPGELALAYDGMRIEF